MKSNLSVFHYCTTFFIFMSIGITQLYTTIGFIVTFSYMHARLCDFLYSSSVSLLIPFLPSCSHPSYSVIFHLIFSYFFQISYMRKVMLYLSFWVCLILSNRIISGSINFPNKNMLSFFLPQEYYSTVYICYVFLIHFLNFQILHTAIPQIIFQCKASNSRKG
jgi:hypothetical protein